VGKAARPCIDLAGKRAAALPSVPPIAPGGPRAPGSRVPAPQDLDAALRVGVPPGAITELVGPAGVGKSQMAMGLALSAALPRELQGLGAAVMYIGEGGRLERGALQSAWGAAGAGGHRGVHL
jgi:hypothetical protein